MNRNELEIELLAWYRHAKLRNHVSYWFRMRIVDRFLGLVIGIGNRMHEWGKEHKK